MIVINKKYNFHGIDVNVNSSKNYSIQQLNECFECLGLEKVKSVNQYFSIFKESLCLEDVNDFLSPKNKKDYISYLKSLMKKDNLYTSYFNKIIPLKNQFLEMMHPIKYENNLVEIPTYKIGTKTGRVSIKKGFNFLTLKKENRKKLKPLNENYQLFEIDFISCEPNFYIKTEIDNSINEKNIYQFIIDKFDLNIELKTFKNALIALLYGAGNNTIKRLSKLNNSEIKKISDYLKIAKFTEDIRNEFNKNSFFLNFYSKPILSIDNPVNYWIQSSVADFCCLSFYQFLKDNNHLKMHAFIHDAIIVSCPKDNVQNLMKIKQLYDPISKISLPVKINYV